MNLGNEFQNRILGTIQTLSSLYHITKTRGSKIEHLGTPIFTYCKFYFIMLNLSYDEMTMTRVSSLSMAEINNKTAQEVQLEIYSHLTYAQKWEAFLNLRATAWALKAAGIRSLHPNWSEEKIQEEVKRIFLYATT